MPVLVSQNKCVISMTEEEVHRNSRRSTVMAVPVSLTNYPPSAAQALSRYANTHEKAHSLQCSKEQQKAKNSTQIKPLLKKTSSFVPSSGSGIKRVREGRRLSFSDENGLKLEEVRFREPFVLDETIR